MSVPTGSIEFVAYHQPSLPDGDYILTVKQQVRIDGSEYGWGTDQWSSAPSSQLQFSVAGPRFSLDPGVVQAQFPPPKSIGEYYAVLPHIIFNRTTLPWERTIDNSAPSTGDRPRPWMALLLFDKTADDGAPTATNLTVGDLLKAYGQSATPAGQPEFVKVLPRDTGGEPGAGELKLEVGQHLNDRLTVIDVPKQLLWQILPSEEEIELLAHVRKGASHTDPLTPVEYPVVFCNRLPAPGTSEDPPIGTQSIVHLVSLESRKPLLDALKTQPADNNPVRLISLASWSFSTMQRNKTFAEWLKEAWCPDASRTDIATGASCAPGVMHTLRMPANGNAAAERFLSQGYAPIKHQTRQGNHIVSWYRGPFLPGKIAAVDLELPVSMSDELVCYFGDVGMFDVTYAAAWELGRTLTLRSKQISLALFNWKRTHALQARQAEEQASHLPFAPDHSIAPDFPKQVSEWFAALLRLEHVPFHYLVPREEMLPANSLRFFSADPNWLACLLDGAFSVGRVSSTDLAYDRSAHKADYVPDAPTYSGFLLRSHVVTGWPHLGVEAYKQAAPAGSTDYIPGVPAAPCLRMDRLGQDILLCLFQDDIQTVDIHEHPDTIHFGVDTTEPGDINTYYKQLRKLDGTLSGNNTMLSWKNGSSSRRVIDIAALAAVEKVANSAEFGVSMIEGVDKVRFIKQHA
jgi:hypothetical protein